MVNTKGGKKHKRTKKISYSVKFPKKKADFEDYGYIISMNGGQHCRVLLSDGLEYTGVMRGSLKKKHIFIKRDGYVLVNRRDFQDGKVDLAFQYANEQLDELKDDKTFKSLKTLVDQKNNNYNYESDEEQIQVESEEEDDTEGFYEMMNRLSEEKKNMEEIDINAI